MTPVRQRAPTAAEPGHTRRTSQAPLDAQATASPSSSRRWRPTPTPNRVTLYTLQASGLQGSPPPTRAPDPEERLFQAPRSSSVRDGRTTRARCSALADDTGGRAILDANDFLPELARMQEDFSSFYSLGYTPAHTGDGRDHKIEVKVKRPGLRAALPPELPRQAGAREAGRPHPRRPLLRHRGQPAGRRGRDRRHRAGRGRAVRRARAPQDPSLQAGHPEPRERSSRASCASWWRRATRRGAPPPCARSRCR